MEYCEKTKYPQTLNKLTGDLRIYLISQFYGANIQSNKNSDGQMISIQKSLTTFKSKEKNETEKRILKSSVAIKRLSLETIGETTTENFQKKELICLPSITNVQKKKNQRRRSSIQYLESYNRISNHDYIQKPVVLKEKIDDEVVNMRKKATTLFIRKQKTNKNSQSIKKNIMINNYQNTIQPSNKNKFTNIKNIIKSVNNSKSNQQKKQQSWKPKPQISIHLNAKNKLNIKQQKMQTICYLYPLIHMPQKSEQQIRLFQKTKKAAPERKTIYKVKKPRF